MVIEFVVLCGLESISLKIENNRQGNSQKRASYRHYVLKLNDQILNVILFIAFIKFLKISF